MSIIDIFNNIKNRFSNKNYLTNLGPLLISLNPYQRINAFSLEKMKEIINLSKDNKLDKVEESSVFITFSKCYNNLFSKKKNQLLILNGETGSGKTTILKYFYQYLLFETKENKPKTKIEEKLIYAQVILEAFGNCKTLKNDNSSRFNNSVSFHLDTNTKQLQKVQFDIIHFEKYRIYECPEEERLFHIFYQIIKGGGSKLLDVLNLTSDTITYKYLSVTKCLVADTIKDDIMFKETDNALKKIGFTDKEILNIYKYVAAILLLGNVNFKDLKGTLIIEDKSGPFTKVCKLLEISPESLESSLSNSIKIINDKLTKTVLKAAECNVLRNILASDLYNRLFIWIVNKINLLMNPIDNNEMFNPIGIIEIFDSIGFESNFNNNYDTLVSNYISEKLNSLLLNDLIKRELNFLEKEGANVSDFTYRDNSSIIELFEKPSTGIISIIDEFSLSNLDDKAFFTKISKLYPNNPLFKISNSTWKFSISHSCKDIEYNSFGCVSKNLDTIRQEFIDCMVTSKNQSLKLIYFNCIKDQEIEKQITLELEKKSSRQKSQDNFYFQKILKCWDQFYMRSKGSESSHILCVNSNYSKKKENLTKNILFSYINTYNLYDILRARKEYQIKISYEDFFFMFEDICNWEGKMKVVEYKNNKQNYDFKQLAIKCLDIIANNKNNEIVLGNTLILIKPGTFNKLIKFMNEKLEIKLNSILKLQNKFRRWVNRKKHLSIKNKVIKIQSIFKGYKMRSLLKKQKQYISIIQGKFRSKKSVKSIIILMKFAKKIQQFVRMRRAKVFIQKMKKSGEFIARKMKQFLLVCRAKRKEKIKNTYYNYIFEKAFDVIKSKVKIIYSITLQKHIRGLLTKIKFFDIIKGARAKRSIYNYEKSSFIIQKNYRGFIVRLKRRRLFSSLFFLQKWWRMSKVKLLVYRMKNGALKIQKNLRIFYNMKKLINKVLNNFFKEEYHNLNQVFNKSKNCIFPNLALTQESSPKKELHMTNYGTNGHNSILEEIQNKKKMEMNFKGNLPDGLDYIEPKMLLFAKILDIDFLVSSEEIYDNGWAEEYEKIYNYNISNGTPIQQIKIGSFHSMAINNKGSLFSWGWNNYGQCGLSVSNIANSENNSIPIITRNQFNKIERIPTNYYLKSGKIAFKNINERFGQIRQVVCAEESSFIIDYNNNLYACGRNNKGQLGLGHTNPVKGFTLIGDLKGKVKLFSTNGEINFAQTIEDEVYLWENETKLTKLVMKKVNIVSVSCGEKFSLILSQQGVVFSFGKCNKFGQLGNGNRLPRSTPEPISELINLGEKVSQISCGFKHCVVKCTSGKVFSWGLNSEGQLGIDSLRDSTLPNLISFESIYPSRINILQVACSYRATFFLTESRTILVCGTFNDFIREKLPVKFNLKFKHPEIADECSYSSVKIVSSWNKSFSIFYSILADIRDINKKIFNRLKVNMMLNSIAGKWETDTMEPPYIESLSGYFTSNCMKKPDFERNRNGSIDRSLNRKKSV